MVTVSLPLRKNTQTTMIIELNMNNEIILYGQENEKEFSEYVLNMALNIIESQLF